MKYFNFKRYKFSTSLKALRELIYDFLKFFRIINFKRYDFNNSPTPPGVMIKDAPEKYKRKLLRKDKLMSNFLKNNFCRKVRIT